MPLCDGPVSKPGGALYSAPRLASVGTIGRISFRGKNLTDFLNVASMSGVGFNRYAHSLGLIGLPPRINYSASPASG